ncbi:hypothetical protein QJS66_15350 [Kocuria rhizophila]|nr:hypothetical protein QJS66_15350 [Kocuria rhizophila]
MTVTIPLQHRLLVLALVVAVLATTMRLSRIVPPAAVGLPLSTCGCYGAPDLVQLFVVFSTAARRRHHALRMIRDHRLHAEHRRLRRGSPAGLRAVHPAGPARGRPDL